MTEEQLRQNDAARASLIAGLIAEIDKKTVLPESTREKVIGELDYQPGEPAPENDTCPSCGGVMKAEADPDSLLAYPMRYVFRCGCGHEETREDDFEFNEEDVSEET